MKLRINRQTVKVSREGGEVEIDPKELGFGGDDVLSSQFITFPLNDKAIEVIITSTVLDEEEKEKRRKMQAELNEDILDGLDEDEL